MKKFIFLISFLFIFSNLFSYDYPISSNHYLVYESGLWASFFGFTGDYANEFNYLNSVSFDNMGDSVLNLSSFFDYRNNYQRFYYSSYIYSIFPYYLTDFLILGREKEDFSNNKLEFIYTSYDPDSETNIQNKIAFSNIYSKNFFDDIGLLIFPNFENSIFNFNKTFYYKFLISNLSFNILPSTNVKEKRDASMNDNNVTMFNTFYIFSNEKPVSISSVSFNTNKTWSLGYYNDFFVSTLQGFSTVHSYNNVRNKNVFLLDSSNNELNKSQTYLSKYGIYLFSYYNKTNIFSTFCEFNKTINNRFYTDDLIYNVRTKIPKLQSNLDYKYNVIGPNSVIYVESIVIK
jgi:hypothetical protein